MGQCILAQNQEEGCTLYLFVSLIFSVVIQPNKGRKSYHLVSVWYTHCACRYHGLYWLLCNVRQYHHIPVQKIN